MNREFSLRRLVSIRRFPSAALPASLCLLFVLGCAGIAPPGERSTAAIKHFKRAEHFFNDGKYSEALKEYRTVTSQFPEDALAAEALYKTAYTELYYKNPSADAELSEKDFQKLIQQYPDSAWVSPAQNWLAVLSQMALLKAESEKLKSDLQRLLDLDMQSERRRRDLK